MYYSHILASQKNPKSYLSIVHEKMDKPNISITRMRKKEKDFTNVMNLPISLTKMLKHEHEAGGLFQFSLLVLEMRSNFIVTSLAKSLSIEQPIVDKYGNFL